MPRLRPSCKVNAERTFCCPVVSAPTLAWGGNLASREDDNFSSNSWGSARSFAQVMVGWLGMPQPSGEDRCAISHTLLRRARRVRGKCVESLRRRPVIARHLRLAARSSSERCCRVSPFADHGGAACVKVSQPLTYRMRSAFLDASAARVSKARFTRALLSLSLNEGESYVVKEGDAPFFAKSRDARF